MRSDDRARRCERCSETVLNLSSRTELGARLAVATGRARCVRYEIDRNGRMAFKRSLLARMLATVAAAMPITALAGPVGPPIATASAPVDGTAAIRVYTVDKDGIPIPGVYLELSDAEHVVTHASTDDDGMAVFGRLPPGTWRIDATLPRFVPARVISIRTASGGETTVPVALEAAGAEGDIVLGGISSWTPPPSLPIAMGGRVDVVTDPGSWRRAALRCAGYARALRAGLSTGKARFVGVPEGGACQVRLAGGARPVVVSFTPRTPEVVVAPDDPSTFDRRR
jgi:hypothetical protein